MTIDRWIAVAGIAASILVTWLVSRYYYKRGDKRRIPTFVVSPSRKILADPGLRSVEELSVLFQGGEVGERGITEAQIYFWNSGMLPILKDDILEPFFVALPGPILHCSVLKSSRKVLDVKVSVSDPLFDDKRASLKFAVLEPGDGATIKVIYDGPPDGNIEFSGACVGAAKPLVLPTSRVYFTPALTRLRENAMLDPLLIMGGFIASLLVLGSLSKRFWGAHVAVKIVGVVFVGFLAILALIGFALSVWEQYEKITAPYVPPDVRP
jgi:hypothetical protein